MYIYIYIYTQYVILVIIIIIIIRQLRHRLPALALPAGPARGVLPAEAPRPEAVPTILYYNMTYSVLIIV